MKNHLTGLDADQKRFVDIFNKLTYSRQRWQIWGDFVTLAACSFSNVLDAEHREEREALYMMTVKQYERDEIDLFPQLLAVTVEALERNPDQDFLGALFQLLDLGNHWKGQFFTPFSVCRMMAKISLGDAKEQVEEKGYISVNDPACGAGALLIAAATEFKEMGVDYQQHVEFIGQDIDFTAAMMAYLQISLTGCPGYIIVGDTLAHPPTVPLPEGYQVWYTPMYFSKVWHWRRLFHAVDTLCVSAVKTPAVGITASPTITLQESKSGQLHF